MRSVRNLARARPNTGGITPPAPFVHSAARRQKGFHLRCERDRREIWRVATQRAPAAAPPAPWAAQSTRATTPTTAPRAAREQGLRQATLRKCRSCSREEPSMAAGLEGHPTHELSRTHPVPERLRHVPRIAATHELKLPKLRGAHSNSFAGSGSNQTRVPLPLRPRMYRMSIPTANNTMTRPRRDQSSASGTGGEQSTTARMTQSPVTPSRQASAQPLGITSAAFKPAWQPSPSQRHSAQTANRYCHSRIAARERSTARRQPGSSSEPDSLADRDGGTHSSHPRSTRAH